MQSNGESAPTILLLLLLTKIDLKYVWSDVWLGRNVTLLCNGLKTASKKRKDDGDQEGIVDCE